MPDWIGSPVGTARNCSEQVVPGQSTDKGVPSVRVLIVDDDVLVVRALKRRYARIGGSVVMLCRTIEDVKVAVANFRPENLVFDHSIIASGGDGFAIAQHFRGHEAISR